MKRLWNRILDSYKQLPRDVLTAGGRKYFFAYTENDDIYVESGREHQNASSIKARRRLDKENLAEIYEIYTSGEKASRITDITFNSVYWYGIFKDLDI